MRLPGGTRPGPTLAPFTPYLFQFLSAPTVPWLWEGGGGRGCPGAPTLSRGVRAGPAALREEEEEEEEDEGPGPVGAARVRALGRVGGEGGVPRAARPGLPPRCIAFSAVTAVAQRASVFGFI